MMKKVSVILPTYNEEGNIGRTIRETISTLKKKPYLWEILIVDNASQDKTKEIVTSFTKKFRNIKAIWHDQNLGYATSTKTGFKKSRGDIIIMMDSDGQHSPSDIPLFIKEIEKGYGLVVGWKKKREDPFLRILISRFYNQLFRIIFGIPLHDVDCGYKALTKALVKKLNISFSNIPVGAEICSKTKALKFNIAEIQVKHFPRRQGKSIFSLRTLLITVPKTFLALFLLKFSLSSYKKDFK